MCSFDLHAKFSLILPSTELSVRFVPKADAANFFTRLIQEITNLETSRQQKDHLFENVPLSVSFISLNANTNASHYQQLELTVFYVSHLPLVSDASWGKLHQWDSLCPPTDNPLARVLFWMLALKSTVSIMSNYSRGTITATPESELQSCRMPVETLTFLCLQTKQWLCSGLFV